MTHLRKFVHALQFLLSLPCWAVLGYLVWQVWLGDAWQESAVVLAGVVIVFAFLCLGIEHWLEYVQAQHTFYVDEQVSKWEHLQ